MGNAVIRGCLTLTCAVLALGAGQCPPGKYRDHEPGLCYPCSDICLTGHQDKLCRIKCPDYGMSRPKGKDRSLDLAAQSLCPKGSYYDVNVDKCDSCSSICDYHKIQHTTKDCLKHCPDEYKTEIGFNSGVPGNSKLNESVVVILVAAVTILVVVFAIGVVCFRKYRSTNTPTPPRQSQPDSESLFPSIQCSQQSAPQSNESSAADVHTPVEVSLAFPELLSGYLSDTTESTF